MKKFVQLIANPIWAHVLFWSWNFIFLAFVLMGFLPLILFQLFQGMDAGWIPLSFVIFGCVMVAVPLISVVLAFVALRSSPRTLLTFGYGVQAPLMLVLLVRFFALREVMPTVALILSAALIGLMALLWQILDQRIDERPAIVQGIRLTGMSLLLVVGAYISVWMAFYVPPVAMGVIQMVVNVFRELPNAMLRGPSGPPLEALLYLPFMFLGFLLMVYSGTLFVGIPIIAPLIYVRGWWRSVRAARRKLGTFPALALPMGIVVACAVAFVITNRQPQRQVFALLEKPPTSPADISALQQQEGAIRIGLLNAYLAPQRYVSAAGEVTHVREMYEWSLGLSPEQATSVQGLYEAVASPILYEPALPVTDTLNVRSWEQTAFTADAKRAAELYQQYFDKPINKAEHEPIVAAMRANWDVNRVTEAWQAVDEREVLLLRQELTITEQANAGYADAELYEVYENQTMQQQEVVYYFNLPESAVVTGVWLGNTPNRNERFAYRVSPRGAAQQLYRNEVQVRRDPALVEQIGPRQYRLRVFPIEPRGWRWDSTGNRSSTQEPLKMHMWLTWRMLPERGQYNLPHLSEKRNAYWTAATVRLLNGQIMPNASDESLTAWMPAAISATHTAQPTVRRVDFPNGQTVLATPVDQNASTPDLAARTIAVVLDRSRSMQEQSPATKAALAQLRERFGPQTDVYMTAAQTRAEGPMMTTLGELDADKIVYFGGQDPADLIEQFVALSAGKRYDAILILTDSGGDAVLGKEGRAVPTVSAPLWMVHLGGLPMGYDDKLMDAILVTGGNIAITLDEVFVRMAARGQSAGIITDVSGGYSWQTLPTAAITAQNGQVQTLATDNPFAALAARRLILAEVQRNRGAIGDAAVLDQLHKIAIKQSIVSPYSSMIVLVNDVQRKALDELEKKGDRFERELETVGETNNGGQPIVTGVPEPHEWALIALATIMLIVYMRRRKLLRSFRQNN